MNVIMKLISTAKPVSFPGVDLDSSNFSLEILTKNKNYGMNL